MCTFSGNQIGYHVHVYIFQFQKRNEKCLKTVEWVLQLSTLHSSHIILLVYYYAHHSIKFIIRFAWPCHFNFLISLCKKLQKYIIKRDIKGNREPTRKTSKSFYHDSLIFFVSFTQTHQNYINEKYPSVSFTFLPLCMYLCHQVLFIIWFS